MSYMNFDLNIKNYKLSELEEIFQLNDKYDINELTSLKDSILRVKRIFFPFSLKQFSSYSTPSLLYLDSIRLIPLTYTLLFFQFGLRDKLEILSNRYIKNNNYHKY